MKKLYTSILTIVLFMSHSAHGFAGDVEEIARRHSSVAPKTSYDEHSGDSSLNSTTTPTLSYFNSSLKELSSFPSSHFATRDGESGVIQIPWSSSKPHKKLSKTTRMFNGKSHGIAADKEPCDFRENRTFWGGQPVVLDSDNLVGMASGPILNDTGVLFTEPNLGSTDVQFDTMDLYNDTQFNEVHNFLEENYVEDMNQNFYLSHSREQLMWSLTPPNYKAEWIVGMRDKKTHELAGFISGMPMVLSVRGELIKTVLINYLAIKKRFRLRGWAPILIAEVGRRVRAEGVYQAVFTGNVKLSIPVSVTHIYHKMIAQATSGYGSYDGMTDRRNGATPSDRLQTAIRPLRKDDIRGVTDLLNTYLKKFSLYPVRDAEEWAYWLLPREGVVDSFVIENNGNITDVLSFTWSSCSTRRAISCLPKRLKRVFSFYTVATTVPLKALMSDAMLIAKHKGAAQFFAGDLMENETSNMLDDLEFQRGSEFLYFLYNWRTASIPPKELGLVIY